jgi:hypothetical protein
MIRTLTAVLSMLAAATFAAAVENLPLERDLPVASIELELDDAWIEVRLEADAAPSLRAEVMPGSEDGQASLEISDRGGQVRIARAPAGDSATTPTLTLELVLDRTQSIQVRGTRLGIAVREAASPEPTIPGAKSGNAEPSTAVAVTGHRFDLTDSEVQLQGASAITVTGNNTVVYSENGVGAVVAELTFGSLTLREQQGSLQLTATDSESTIESLDGDISFTLTGGGLDVRNGSGRIQGTSQGGMVATSGWEGDISITGTEATVALREGRGGQTKIIAEDSDVTLDGIDGSLIIQLKGGQLSADRISGTAKISGSQSGRFSLRDSDGTLDLTLRDESSGEVVDVMGTLNAQVADGSLDISGAQIVNLTAARSEVTVANIRRLAKFNVQSSEVGLDLREAQDRALNLRVPDDVDITVDLPSPCRVQLQGGSGTSQGLDVSGCELQLERLGRWKGAGRRDLEGRRPFLLTATLAPTGQLRVRGGS